MISLQDIAPFTLLDVAAVLATALMWYGIGWRIEHSPAHRPSVSHIMTRYRRDWMVHYVTRQPRIFDSAVLDTLRQGPSFFASACMIAIGGSFAILSNPEELTGVAEDLMQETIPAFYWEVKIVLTIIFLTNAFLAFVWSHRLFGYCAVVMASTPNEASDPAAYPRAAKAAELNITAARSFNRGLRSVYFALASLTWFAGPVVLLVGAGVTTFVLWRREFASASRENILKDDT